MAPLEVIYTDDDLIAINKPAGLTVHGPLRQSGSPVSTRLDEAGEASGPQIREATLVDFVLERFPEIRNVGEDPLRPGLVHRLEDG